MCAAKDVKSTTSPSDAWNIGLPLNMMVTTHIANLRAKMTADHQQYSGSYLCKG